MDKTAILKESLISRINKSQDVNFLNALQTLFDSAEQELFELSDEQESSIKIGREEIKNGTFHKHDDVISEMKQWLQKK